MLRYIQVHGIQSASNCAVTWLPSATCSHRISRVVSYLEVDNFHQLVWTYIALPNLLELGRLSQNIRSFRLLAISEA